MTKEEPSALRTTWQRQRVAMIAGSWLVSLLFAGAFYLGGLPFKRLLLRPIVTIGMLALIFLPVAIGTYLGRQKKD